MEKSKDHIAIPPGETIRELLAAHHMAQIEFARRMAFSEKHASQLINGKVPLSREIANRLEYVLGHSSSFWNNLERIYRDELDLVHAENELTADLDLIRKYPVAEMIRMNWITRKNRRADTVKELRIFFEVANLRIPNDPSIWPLSCPQSRRRGKAWLLTLALAQKARLEARSRSSARFNKAGLQRLAQNFRSMTCRQPGEFLPDLQRALAAVGVVFMIFRNLAPEFGPGLSLQDHDRIILILSDQGLAADTLWWRLLHEVGHILNGDLVKKDGPSPADEAAADRFASDSLIDAGHYEAFVRQGHFAAADVQSFAAREGISAALVVSRLHQDKVLAPGQLAELVVPYRFA